MDVGTLPQWITAVIAIAAGGIAIWNINSQRAIARRRAAFDLFLKTETDDKMLTAYDNLHKGINAMKAAPNIDEFCTSEATREHYLCIRELRGGRHPGEGATQGRLLCVLGGHSHE